MKKILTITLLSLTALVLLTATSHAAPLGTIRSFGGRVTTTMQPGVTCAAQYGPITIVPTGGIFPPTPYVIGATTKTVTPGGWILGLYNSVLAPGLCYTDTAPPVPYPTYTIIKFGASKTPSFFK